MFQNGFPRFQNQIFWLFLGQKRGGGGENVDQGLTTPLSRTQGVNIYGFKSLEPNEALFDKRREAGGGGSKNPVFNRRYWMDGFCFYSFKAWRF